MTDKLATAAQLLAPGWTEDQRALIKRQVAPNATDDELAMFLHVARVSGLDPLRNEIYFVKREWTDRHGKKQVKVNIQAGADGLQARALEMGDCTGIRSAVVYAKDDFVFNMVEGEVVKHQCNPFGERGHITGAWGIVERKGLRPFYALVRFTEYNDTNAQIWQNKPAVMIEKVARATALRRAYPKNFGGIYDPAEMGKQAIQEVDEDVVTDPKALPSHKRETEKFEASQKEKLPPLTPEVVAAHSAPPPDNVQKAAEALLDAAEEAEELRARAEAESDAAEDPILAKIAASKTVRDLMVVFKGVKDRTPYMEAWNAAAERIADGKQPLPAKKA